MSELDQQQIEHIAHLARLELSAKEQQKFTQQLGDILDYFKQLNELNIQDQELTSQLSDSCNVYYPDEIKLCDEKTQRQILSNAPQKSKDYFKVNKIIQDDQ